MNTSQNPISGTPNTDVPPNNQSGIKGKNTRLIVVCGVDGAGKSSLIEALRAKKIPNAAFVHKKSWACARLVNLYYSRSDPRPSDWISGAFAEMMGHACLMDFLSHFDDNIRPLIGQYDYLFCDRYFYCFAAFLRIVRPDLEVLSKLSATIPSPELVVHVRVELARLRERYEMRGGASEDESLELMSRIDREYLTLFESLGRRVVRVENNGSFEDTFNTVSGLLKNRFPELPI